LNLGLQVAPVCHAALREGKALGSPGGRRRRLWGLLVLAVALALLLYAWAIEPYWIEVTHHQVTAPLDAPLLVAHLSDMHLYGVGRRERTLLALLEREKPDLIVITGDSVIDGDLLAPVREEDDLVYERAAAMFDRLHAPLGVWAVRGNWENVRRLRHEDAFYARHGIRLLVDEAREVRPGFWIAGLDDIQSDPDLAATARAIPPGAFVLALFHSPAYFDAIAGRWPLALAGHTHGGQVRPPLVPPFWLPAGSGRYLAGWYQAPGSRMYVSRGVGTSTLPVRFLCRPELAMIRIGPAGR
jgi:predicted MPP superfamily phosphohydrolase